MKVTPQRVDVADKDAMFAWADQVVADHGKVNLIFNNAGVAARRHGRGRCPTRTSSG